jgi:hypothetical protein
MLGFSYYYKIDTILKNIKKNKDLQNEYIEKY